MRLLLDTHVLVWLAEGLDLLPAAGREAIDAAAADAGLAVSAISFWEVAMLAERRRLSLSIPVIDWRRRLLEAPSLIEAPFTGAVGIEAVQLPGSLHADPADRFIVATARLQGWRLATRDERLLAFGREGHVNVMAI